MDRYASGSQTTPPDTVPVKFNGAYKPQYGGAEAQRNLEFADTPEVSRPHRASSGLPAGDIEAMAAEPAATPWENARSVLLWENPLLSGVLVAAGVMVGVAGDYILKGKHGLPLLSGLAYLLLLDLALNFARSVLSVKWQESSAWVNSASISSLASAADAAVMRLAALHDTYLSCKDPLLTLRVAGVLWALSWLGYALSMWRLACLAYFAAFAVGALTSFCREPIVRTYTTVTTAMKERYSKLGIKRSQSGVILVTALVLLMLYSSWATRLLTVFVALIIVRCNLKTSEVDAIASTADRVSAPYVHSAKKQARRLSVAASDFMRRSSFGMKAHRR